jgi:hypothetical protein
MSSMLHNVLLKPAFMAGLQRSVTSTNLGEEMAKAIILDVHSGQYTFVDKSGDVRQPHDE